MTGGLREFTEQERAILDFLIQDLTPDADVLRAQIAVAKFESPWFEGSQSFTFVVAGDAPRVRGTDSVDGTSALVYDNATDHSDNHCVGGMFLWKKDGALDSLEFWWVTDEMPSELPPLSHLKHQLAWARWGSNPRPAD